MKKIFTSVAAGIFFLLISCSAKINSGWQSKTATAQKCNKIIVRGIMNAKALLYSAQTTSFEFGSVEQLAHQYGRTVIVDMMKRKIFIKPDESSLYQKGF